MSGQQWARPHTPLSTWLSTLVPVVLGGAMGTMLRWLVVDVALRVMPGPLLTPIVAISLVNVAGAWLLGRVSPRMPGQWARAFVLTGLLGSFTTWSTFMVDAVALFRLDASLLLVIVHVVGTNVVGLLAAQAGHRRGRAGMDPSVRGAS